MANISGNALYYDNISIPGNQMYITFQDDEIGPETKLHLKIHKSLYNELSYHKNYNLLFCNNLSKEWYCLTLINKDIQYSQMYYQTSYDKILIVRRFSLNYF